MENKGKLCNGHVLLWLLEYNLQLIRINGNQFFHTFINDLILHLVMSKKVEYSSSSTRRCQLYLCKDVFQCKCNCIGLCFNLIPPFMWKDMSCMNKLGANYISFTHNVRVISVYVTNFSVSQCGLKLC